MSSNDVAEGFSLDPWVDAGCGVSMRLRRFEGTLDALEYRHECKEGTREESIPLSPSWGGYGWQVHTESPLTLSPSLRCTTCGLHGWVRGGRWIPC